MHTQEKSNRRSFIVTVPVWRHHSGRDDTLKLLREAMDRSFLFGDPETKAEKATVRPMPAQPKADSGVGK